MSEEEDNKKKEFLRKHLGPFVPDWALEEELKKMKDREAQNKTDNNVG